jgi:hypothetical protein
MVASEEGWEMVVDWVMVTEEVIWVKVKGGAHWEMEEGHGDWAMAVGRVMVIKEVGWVRV